MHFFFLPVSCELSLAAANCCMGAARECSGPNGKIEFVSCNTILFVEWGYSCNDI